MLKKYGLFYVLLVLTAYLIAVLFNPYLAFRFYGDRSGPSSYLVFAAIAGCLVHYTVMRQRGHPAVSGAAKPGTWMVLLEGAMIGALLGAVAGGAFTHYLAVQVTDVEFGGLVWLFLPMLLIGGAIAGAVLGLLITALRVYFFRHRKNTK